MYNYMEHFDPLSNIVKSSSASESKDFTNPEEQDLHSDIVEISTEVDRIGIKQLLEFDKLDEGAVKVVWILKNLPSSHQDSLSTNVKENVYYTPLYFFKESELRAEFQKVQKIALVILSKNLSGEHLVLDIEEVPADERIEGKYTLKVERASKNFEKKIQDPSTTLPDRVKFAEHFLDGMTNLHLAGYIYGDVKPENCLIFNGVLRISDFGKTEEVPKDGKAATYKGNKRFAPPEGVLSQKGDVYSAGMVLIRTFEEAFLSNVNSTSETPIKKEAPTEEKKTKETPTEEKKTESKSLVPIGEKDVAFDMTADKKLRGVERYVVEHKAFLASNPGISPKGAGRRLYSIGKNLLKEMNIINKNNESNKNPEENPEYAMYRYIAALSAKLMESGFLTFKQADDFSTLLQDMTRVNPEERIGMEEALERYQNIFHSKQDKN